MGAADHRLRRAAPGAQKDTFSEPIFNPSTAPGAEDTIKNVTVHFVKVTGGLGNLNTGINQTLVNSLETQIMNRYAVAGINPTFVYNDSNDVIHLSNTTAPEDTIDITKIDGDDTSSLGGQYLIAQELRTKYGAYTQSNKTIYVVIIPEFKTSPDQPGGLSYTDGIAGPGTSLAIFLHISFVAQIGGVNNNAAAPHELGHQFSDQVPADAGTDNNHYIGLNKNQNLMYDQALDGNSLSIPPIAPTVIGSKRLWDDPIHTDGVHDYQIDYMRTSPLLY